MASHASTAMIAVLLAGCSGKAPEDYTFAPVSAYVTCTAKARAGLDARKVSSQQAEAIVDRCDAELQTAAQALAARRAYEDRLGERGSNLTATQNLGVERQVLRDLALCSTSAEVSPKLCPRVD